MAESIVIVGAKRLLAFIPDEPQLFEYMTVDDHLAFIARLYGVDSLLPVSSP